MRLTIIPVDGAVHKDGYSYSRLQQIGAPSNIHALQWVETEGHLEFNDGTPNEAITELPDWVETALEKWEEANTLANTVPELFGLEVPEILNTYPSADLNSVKNILNTTYQGLVLGPRVREIDNTTIGVTVIGVAGGDTSAGGSAMLAIRRLTEDCINNGVPIITVASFPTLSNTQFGEYYKSLGGTDYVDLGDSVLVYTPWTLSMAKKRKKAVINTERAKAIAAGIAYAGNTWDADPDSVAAIIARNSVNQTSDVVWRAKDNSMIRMTASEFNAFTAAIVESIQSLYEASWSRKTAVDTAATEDEVNAI